MRIVRYYPRAAEGDGGMTMAVNNWSEAFARAGIEAVIAFDRGRPPGDRELVEWIPVPHRGPRGKRLPVGLDRVLHDADLLVLHSGWTLHNLRAAATARRLGVPYVLEPRGAYDPHITSRKRLAKRAWWWSWERKLVAGAAAIHIFFEEERSHLADIGYEGPVIVASNGVSPPEIEWSGEEGYLLWLGRFDPEHKGLDILLEGLTWLLPDSRPQVRIHGPDWRSRKGDVSRLIDDLGLADWVTLGSPTYGEAKREMLARCGAFIYPSRWDACPNAVLEAVSMGIPTITTPYPLGHYLAERGGSLLAEPAPIDIARAISRAYSNDAERIGKNGAEIARSELGWDEVARSWLSQVASLV